MNVEFEAKYVSYDEAIGGDIVQALFEEEIENENEDPFRNTKLYLLISANYEFGSPIPQAEWYDGKKANGGVDVEAFRLTRTEATIRLRNGDTFKICYSERESVLREIRVFLSQNCRTIDA